MAWWWFEVGNCYQVRFVVSPQIFPWPLTHRGCKFSGNAGLFRRIRGFWTFAFWKVVVNGSPKAKPTVLSIGKHLLIDVFHQVAVFHNAGWRHVDDAFGFMLLNGSHSSANVVDTSSDLLCRFCQVDQTPESLGGFSKICL